MWIERTGRVVALALAIGAAVLTGAAPATGAVGYQELGPIATGPWDGLGDGIGKVSAPVSVVVDGESGRVFVLDTGLTQGYDRISIYDVEGDSTEYVTEIRIPYLPTVPTISGAQDFALDEDSGALYVAAVGTGSTLRRFVSDGAPAPTYTEDPGFVSPAIGDGDDQIDTVQALAFDQDNDQLVVADYRDGAGGKRVKRFTASGAYVPGSAFDGSTSSHGAFQGFSDVGVADDGDVFVVALAGGANRAMRFAADGEHRSTLSADVPGLAFAPVRIVEDALNGQVVVGLVTADGGRRFRFDVFEGDAYRFSFRPPAGVPAPTDDFGVAMGDLAAGGPGTGRLYFGERITGPSSPSSVQAYAPGPPPTVSTSAPVAIRSDRAVIGGSVNPNGVSTDFWIEYGETDAYGASLPASQDADAGSGRVALGHSRLLLGLEPDTTYHFRVVARNGSGTVLGNDQTFETPAPTSQGERRVYEQVSPADKRNNGVAWRPGAPSFGITAAAPDGDTVAFDSWGTFGGSDTGLVQTYRSRRTANGWVTRTASPPPVLKDTNTGFCPCPVTWAGGTPDLATGWITTAQGWSDADANSPAVGDIFGKGAAVDAYTRGPDDQTDLVSIGSNGEATGNVFAIGTAGISDDGRSVLFTSSTVGIVPELADKPEGFNDLYERRDGETRFVGQGPDGEPASDCGTNLAGTAAGWLGSSPAISTDGSHVVFETVVEFCNGPAPRTRELFVRIDGERTLAVSESRRSEPDPAGRQSAEFVYASADGSRIFFRSRELLTDDAEVPPGRSAEFLYEYRVDAPDPLRVVFDGADSSTQELVAISRDGRRIFFRSRAALAPGGTDGSENLYVVDDDGTEWIATSRDGALVPTGDPLLPLKASGAVSTADGSALLFAASGDAIGGYDTNGKTQIYLYRQGEPLRCMSCAASATPPAHNAWLNSGLGQGSPGEFASSLSADGSRVAFQTREALLPSDTNRREDVYEWHDGVVSLVSPGTGSSDSYLLGMSDDGKDVFFTTYDALLPQDVDGGDMDIYNARLGGGFPAQGGGERPPCAGDGCQGSPASAPAPRKPVTGGPGRGNAVPAKRAAFSVRGLTSGRRVAVGRDGRLSVPVRVSRAGMVRVTATGKVSRRSRATIGRASKRARRAGTVRVPLRLSPAARRALANRGRLAVWLSVSFSGAGQGRRLSLTLTNGNAASDRKGR